MTFGISMALYALSAVLISACRTYSLGRVLGEALALTATLALLAHILGE